MNRIVLVAFFAFVWVSGVLAQKGRAISGAVADGVEKTAAGGKKLSLI